MSDDNIMPGNLPSLEQAGRQHVLQALELLIQIFWTSDGRKNWEELWKSSSTVWTGLHGIVFREPPRIVIYLNELRDQGKEAVVIRDLENVFVDIFINTYGGISAPLYHSCYHGDEQRLMQQPAQEMQERLSEAGLVPGKSGEPVDHLCLELEYLYFLISLYQQSPDPEIAAETADFSGKFMLPWIDEFLQRIPTDYHAAAFFAKSTEAMRDLLKMLGRTG
ncbi:molecular chaperone TorD family protein [Desulfonatronospira sp.]|uniref:molecular chaperone TorD family protein n=1 Tax=Desulfonatronospira sp. TaxID=1962951 RepID=UPI0025C0BE91|nr:molecular chaperone TorD family protein [Desulfonatronospira sp.]